MKYWNERKKGADLGSLDAMDNCNNRAGDSFGFCFLIKGKIRSYGGIY